MTTYVPPYYPFPWPKELDCGQPYINWPSNHDIIIRGSIDTEVAIPESWVNIGVADGEKNVKGAVVNRTKEEHTLILRKKSKNSSGRTVFASMYRNKKFETSDDEFIKPEKYYLEYLGSPTAHSEDQSCDTTYHLLSYRFDPTGLQGYQFYRQEGPDWLFQLYPQDEPKSKYDIPTIDPILSTDLIQLCHYDGKHTNRKFGNELACNFTSQTSTSSILGPTNTGLPANHGDGRNLGLVIGLPIGLIGGLAVIIGIAIYFVPDLRRRVLRDEGGISL